MDWTLVLFALLVLAVLGILFGALLSYAGKKFEVKVDERVEKVRAQLGGANCGACGFAGCDAFAEAVVEGKARPNGCPPGGPAAASAIGEIMGLSVEVTERKVAKVFCQGSSAFARERYKYEGFPSCRIVSSLSGGNKLCPYSCIGLGDCVQACAFGAISIQNGIAKFDTTRCGGCGECVKECPRSMIMLVPESATVRMKCQNHDAGKIARESCLKACIACKRCERECTEHAITVIDNVAVIDYDKCTRCGACAKVCPIGCILDKTPRAETAS